MLRPTSFAGLDQYGRGPRMSDLEMVDFFRRSGGHAPPSYFLAGFANQETFVRWLEREMSPTQLLNAVGERLAAEIESSSPSSYSAGGNGDRPSSSSPAQPTDRITRWTAVNRRTRASIQEGTQNAMNHGPFGNQAHPINQGAAQLPGTAIKEATFPSSPPLTNLQPEDQSPPASSYPNHVRASAMPLSAPDRPPLPYSETTHRSPTPCRSGDVVRSPARPWDTDIRAARGPSMTADPQRLESATTSAESRITTHTPTQAQTLPPVSPMLLSGGTYMVIDSTAVDPDLDPPTGSMRPRLPGDPIVYDDPESDDLQTPSRQFAGASTDNIGSPQVSPPAAISEQQRAAQQSSEPDFLEVGDPSTGRSSQQQTKANQRKKRKADEEEAEGSSSATVFSKGKGKVKGKHKKQKKTE